MIAGAALVVVAACGGDRGASLPTGTPAGEGVLLFVTPDPPHIMPFHSAAGPGSPGGSGTIIYELDMFETAGAPATIVRIVSQVFDVTTGLVLDENVASAADLARGGAGATIDPRAVKRVGGALGFKGSSELLRHPVRFAVEVTYQYANDAPRTVRLERMLGPTLRS